MMSIDVMEVLNQFELDTKYLEDHTGSWLDQHSDCWVAVYKQRLLGYGATHSELMGKIRPSGDDRNIVVEYISKNPPQMLL